MQSKNVDTRIVNFLQYEKSPNFQFCYVVDTQKKQNWKLLKTWNLR